MKWHQPFPPSTSGLQTSKPLLTLNFTLFVYEIFLLVLCPFKIQLWTPVNKKHRKTTEKYEDTQNYLGRTRKYQVTLNCRYFWPVLLSFMVFSLVHTGDLRSIVHVLLPQLVALKASPGLGFCSFSFVYFLVFHKYIYIFIIK